MPVGSVFQSVRAILPSTLNPLSQPVKRTAAQDSGPDWLKQAASIADPILNVGANEARGLEKSAHRAMAWLIRHLATGIASEEGRSSAREAALEVMHATDDLKELHGQLGAASKPVIERLQLLRNAIPDADKSMREAISHTADQVEFFLHELWAVGDSASDLRESAAQIAGPETLSAGVEPGAEALRSAYELVHDRSCKRLQRELNRLDVRSAEISLRQNASNAAASDVLGQEIDRLSADLLRLLEDLVKDIASLHFPNASKIFPGSTGIHRLESLLDQVDRLDDVVCGQKEQLSGSTARRPEMSGSV